ncbi:ABC transporter permease subunit [Streptomyces sp. VRA16 Mangrove soil]|uniref:ABC transporter permease subunit n=1 Tax=Streptomyces sp. VRA16 Mangrove soil TaxID=2817434 RepID=UPI001A9D4988|nr:ABC transporter permease subunit [Streptomyces sp. VRA16 Mangrove soil]MBO1337442.1 ABC transporter permease subunit [Streptomyces sp. VRA16 Mangrove soil]
MRKLTVGIGRAVAVGGLLAVTALLPWLTRTDPALTVLHARYGDAPTTPEQLAQVRDRLGLGEGPFTFFGQWVRGLAHGDLGTSWVTGADVASDVAGSFWVSVSLMAYAMVVAVGVAVAVWLPALRRGRPEARGGAVAGVLAALPEFLIASVLATLFAVRLGWFPAQGWASPASAVLPALALGIPAGAVLGRLGQDALPTVFAEPWVRTMRAGGMPRSRIARRAVRRMLPAVLPQAGLTVVGLTGAAAAVEAVFAIPGLGGTAVAAALDLDLPLLQGCLLVLLALGVAAAVTVGLVRRRLLGPALAAGALPGATRVSWRGASYAGWILGALLLGVIGWGLTRDPLQVDLAARLVAPSRAHPFGTDALGRDVLARLGHGALRTLLTAAVVCAVCFVAGVLLGLVRAAKGLTEVANALPAILAGLLVTGLFGAGQTGAAVAVAAVGWAPLAAHTAALAEAERGAGHLAAARALGAGRGHVLRRHVLPGVLPPVARHAALRLAPTTLALASLSFLGLGTQPPTPEWGRLLMENLPYAERAPWAVLAPAAALAVVGATVALTGRRTAQGRA